MIWYLNRLHAMLSLNRQDQFLDTSLPKKGRLFLYQTVDAVVTRHAKLRRLYPDLQDKVFHSARKWFITQRELTGTPEHFTSYLYAHHSARSANKLTYGLYLAGISEAQKREIVAGIRLSISPNLPRNNFNLFNAQQASVIDPMEVLNIMVFRIKLPKRFY
jgi:hypothetical protein